MRQRRASYDYPEDFAGALNRFKEASGLSWGALARELGTSRLNLWRWRNGVRPNTDH
ncbi:MAG: helix-turn-helix domain-containing protein, partial [Dehalococcoidia bacterium]|nr:helix-turn-helix domain-containing protein [Dehalococcoidia bacterium]